MLFYSLDVPGLFDEFFTLSRLREGVIRSVHTFVCFCIYLFRIVIPRRPVR